MGQDASGLTTGRVIQNSYKELASSFARGYGGLSGCQAGRRRTTRRRTLRGVRVRGQVSSAGKLACKEGPPKRRRRIDRWSSSFPSRGRTSPAHPIRFSKQFLEDVFSEVSLQTRRPTARCSDSEPMRTSPDERLLRRPKTKDSLRRRRRHAQGPGGSHLLREPLLAQAIREQSRPGRISGSEEEPRIGSEARREGQEAARRRSP